MLSLEIPTGSPKVSWTEFFLLLFLIQPPGNTPEALTIAAEHPGGQKAAKVPPQSRPATGCPGGLKLSLILEDESAVKLLPLTLVLMRPLNETKFISVPKSTEGIAPGLTERRPSLAISL